MFRTGAELDTILLLNINRKPYMEVQWQQDSEEAEWVIS